MMKQMVVTYDTEILHTIIPFSEILDPPVLCMAEHDRGRGVEGEGRGRGRGEGKGRGSRLLVTLNAL